MSLPNETEPCASCREPSTVQPAHRKERLCNACYIAYRRLALAKPTQTVEEIPSNIAAVLSEARKHVPGAVFIEPNIIYWSRDQWWGLRLLDGESVRDSVRALGAGNFGKGMGPEFARAVGDKKAWPLADARRMLAIEQPEGGEFKVGDRISAIGSGWGPNDESGRRNGTVTRVSKDDELLCMDVDGGNGNWAAHKSTARPISAPPSQPASEAVKADPYCVDCGAACKPDDLGYCPHCRHRMQHNAEPTESHSGTAPKSDLAERIAAAKRQLSEEMDRPSAERRRRVDRRGMQVGEFTSWVSTRHAR